VPNGGLIVMPDTFTDVYRAAIISLAARSGLPAVYPRRIFTELGGLLSYGIDQVDSYRRAATYVDRILKGEKPSELPVQAPVKFELVINLKTAKALGLDVPPLLQQRADEVMSEAARIHYAARRRGGCMAAGSARAAERADAAHRYFRRNIGRHAGR